jgi:AGZA family xanthine/uracil permease-like MFS transporter
LNRILFSDAAATITGSLAGTSTVVSYVESAAGVVAGGRSGVTSIVTGLLFLLALLIAPLIGAIPAAATAPALILVGCMMASHMAEIDWSELRIAIPAFLTAISIPFTFSIANGIAIGFSAYTLLTMLQGDFRRLNWLMYVLTALFLARFYYLSAT